MPARALRPADNITSHCDSRCGKNKNAREGIETHGCAAAGPEPGHVEKTKMPARALRQQGISQGLHDILVEKTKMPARALRPIDLSD